MVTGRGFVDRTSLGRAPDIGVRGWDGSAMDHATAQLPRSGSKQELACFSCLLLEVEGGKLPLPAVMHR